MWTSVWVERSRCMCFHEKESGYMFQINQRKVRCLSRVAESEVKSLTPTPTPTLGILKMPILTPPLTPGILEKPTPTVFLPFYQPIFLILTFATILIRVLQLQLQLRLLILLGIRLRLPPTPIPPKTYDSDSDSATLCLRPL